MSHVSPCVHVPAAPALKPLFVPVCQPFLHTCPVCRPRQAPENLLKTSLVSGYCSGGGLKRPSRRYLRPLFDVCALRNDKAGSLSPASWALPDVTHPRLLWEKTRGEHTRGMSAAPMLTNILRPYCFCTIKKPWVIFNTSVPLKNNFCSFQIWHDFSQIKCFVVVMQDRILHDRNENIPTGCFDYELICSYCFQLKTGIWRKTIMTLKKSVNSERSVDGVKGQSAWPRGHFLVSLPEGHVTCHTWGFRSRCITYGNSVDDAALVIKDFVMFLKFRKLRNLFGFSGLWN